MNTTLLSHATRKTNRFDGPEPHDELARIAERVLEIPLPDTPRLEIHRKSCQVSIAWLGTDEKFRLEISDRAFASADWRPVMTSKQVAGGVHRVLLPGASHIRYVRLARGKAMSPARQVLRRPVAARPVRRAARPNVIAARPAFEPGELLESTALWVVVVAAALVLLNHLAAIH